MTTPRERRLAYLAWGAVCVIWGTTFLCIRIGLETIPPFLLGGIRFVAASALLGGLIVARGGRLPRVGTWGRLAVMGVLLLGLGNGGVVYAEQWVASGLAAVMVASVPFWMIGVEALIAGGERVGARQLTGLLIGLAGIVALVWPDLRAQGFGAGFGRGVLALQIACAGWAVGSAYSRRRGADADASGAATMQMLFGGLSLLAAGTLAGEWGRLAFSFRSGSALAYLAVVGGAGAFTAYTYALRHLAPSFVSLYSYANPVIAVALGTLLLDEPFGYRMVLAGAMILGGISIVRQTSS